METELQIAPVLCPPRGALFYPCFVLLRLLNNGRAVSGSGPALRFHQGKHGGLAAALASPGSSPCWGSAQVSAGSRAGRGLGAAGRVAATCGGAPCACPTPVLGSSPSWGEWSSLVPRAGSVPTFKQKNRKLQLEGTKMCVSTPFKPPLYSPGKRIIIIIIIIIIYLIYIIHNT